MQVPRLRPTGEIRNRPEGRVPEPFDWTRIFKYPRDAKEKQKSSDFVSRRDTMLQSGTANVPVSSIHRPDSQGGQPAPETTQVEGGALNSVLYKRTISDNDLLPVTALPSDKLDIQDSAVGSGDQTPLAHEQSTKQDPSVGSSRVRHDRKYLNVGPALLAASFSGPGFRQWEASPAFKAFAPVARPVTALIPQDWSAQNLAEKRKAEISEQVKGQVWTCLQQKAREFEYIEASIRVEAEIRNSQYVIVVTCGDRAAQKSHLDDVQKILSNSSVRSTFQGLTVQVKTTADSTRFLGSQSSDQLEQEALDGTLGLPFFKTPYWTTDTIMVECLLPDDANQSGRTLCGALLRVHIKDNHTSTSLVRRWTCGGLIYVDNEPYALTTAHTMTMLNERLSSKGKSREMTSDSVDVLIDKHDVEALSGEDEEWGKPSFSQRTPRIWQTLGKVETYALSSIGTIPANNDWLLVSIGNCPILPNAWSSLAVGLQYPESLVCTSHGDILAMQCLGPAMLILGNSAFEAIKFDVSKQLCKFRAPNPKGQRNNHLQFPVAGDSGAWVVRGDKVLGVVVAGVLEEGKYHAYVLSIADVLRSISIGMKDAIVRLPTDTENALLAYKSGLYGNIDLGFLAALRLDNIFAQNADPSSPAFRPKSMVGPQRYTSLFSALLYLGRLSSRLLSNSLAREGREPRFSGIRRKFFPAKISPSSATRSLIENLEQCQEGQKLLDLLFALFSLVKQDTHPITYRHAESDTVFAFEGFLAELDISPAPNKDTIFALVHRACAHGFVRPVKQSHDPGHLTPLPREAGRILARLLHAVHTNAFFIYQGPFAHWINYSVTQFFDVGVVIKISGTPIEAIQPYFNDTTVEWEVPRVFVHATDFSNRPEGMTSAFGDVIKYEELEIALQHMVDIANASWRRKEYRERDHLAAGNPTISNARFLPGGTPLDQGGTLIQNEKAGSLCGGDEA